MQKYYIRLGSITNQWWWHNTMQTKIVRAVMDYIYWHHFKIMLYIKSTDNKLNHSDIRVKADSG